MHGLSPRGPTGPALNALAGTHLFLSLSLPPPQLAPTNSHQRKKEQVNSVSENTEGFDYFSAIESSQMLPLFIELKSPFYNNFLKKWHCGHFSRLKSSLYYESSTSLYNTLPLQQI